MKATREQVLAMAREAHLSAHDAGVSELDRLVHLAQQFERDQLRKRGADYYLEATPLFILPETLE